MAGLRFGGGLNQLDDELISDEDCVEGENFRLDADSKQFRRRPSFDLLGTATNGAEVRGIMQLIKRNDTTTTLIQAGAVVYSWNGSSTFTPVDTCNVASLLRDTYWSLDDVIIITDVAKLTTVRQWNGTAASVFAHNISGVTNLYAKYGAVWQNRLWLFNVTTDSAENSHVILASEFDNFDNMNNALTPTATTLTSSSPFFLTIPDLRPINGIAVFYNSIVISTVEGRFFRIAGTDATDYAIEEFYPGSCAAGTELIVNAGNDVFYVRKGGAIERLLSSDNYGDTTADDLSKWIRREAADISTGLAIYDQAHQIVCFFTSNKILVVDKYSLDVFGNSPGGSSPSPWMKWTTQMSSNLDVEAAKYLRVPGDTDYTVYFGGPTGQIYNLNGTGAGDAGSTLIRTYRKTRLISELNTIDDLVEGRVHYRRKGICELTLTFEWSDEYSNTTCVVPLLGPIVSIGTQFWGGNLYWGQATHYWGAGGTEEDRVSSSGFSAAGKGPSFFLTTDITTTVDFCVNKIEA